MDSTVLGRLTGLAILTGVGLIFGYLLASFVEWEFRPSQWTEVGRLLTIAGPALLVLVIYDSEK